MQATRFLWATVRKGVLCPTPLATATGLPILMRKEPIQQLPLAMLGTTLHPWWLTWAKCLESFLVGAVSMEKPNRHPRPHLLVIPPTLAMVLNNALYVPRSRVRFLLQRVTTVPRLLTKFTFNAFRCNILFIRLPGESPFLFPYILPFTTNGNRCVRVACRHRQCVHNRLVTSLDKVRISLTNTLPVPSLTVLPPFDLLRSLVPTCVLTVSWGTPTAANDRPLCFNESPLFVTPLHMWAWYFTAVSLQWQCPGLPTLYPLPPPQGALKNTKPGNKVPVAAW